MKTMRWRKRNWFGKCLLGLALGIESSAAMLQAQAPPVETAEPQTVSVFQLAAQRPETLTAPTAPALDSCFSSAIAPDCADPVSRVPNFLGDFFGRGSSAFRNTLSTQHLTFTGGGEGFLNEVGPGVVVFPIPGDPTIVLNGPGGPYQLTTNVTGSGSTPNFIANENAELTGDIRAKFPGANFVNGTITLPGSGGPADLFFDYLFTSGQISAVNLPNPAGGGLVGRNKYFDNGSALPRDRVYFFYNHVDGYQGLPTRFDINRYVLGVEKTLLDGRFSVEVRAPFAGTANSDQTVGQGLSVDHTEFGNLGLVFKGAVYRTPNFVLSAGLGLSLPTADDSRMILNGRSVVEIHNETCLLQPLLGVAWAPNDRFYAQAGVQFDIDPSGNPVVARNANNNLARVGVLDDQSYAFASGALGYWVYQCNESRLTGVAVQGELHYNRSVGPRDSVQDGTVKIADLGTNANTLNATTGAIFELGDRAKLSVGVSIPVAGDKQFDWNAITQLNVSFGCRPR